MKKRKPKIIKDKKLRGEWAEMQFMARAAEHGLAVSKPWGEMCSFDFVVGSPSRFTSVQVKSTVFQKETGYNCTVRGGHAAYRAGSFDFLAAYVVPEDAWYIIPARSIRGIDSIFFYPNSKTSKYEQYREAWHLLREAVGVEEAENTESPTISHPSNTAKGGAPILHEIANSETSPLPQNLHRAATGHGASGVVVKRMENAFNFFRKQLDLPDPDE